MNALAEARLAEAASMLDRVSRLFRESGNLLRASAPRASRGWTLMWMGRPEEGLPDTEEAVELARLLGHAEGEGYGLWMNSELLAALGRSQEAREAAEAALAIGQRIGHKELTAVSLMGVGVGSEASGDLEAAEAAYRRSTEAGVGMAVAHSAAASRLASVLIAVGRLDEAEAYVTLALSEGCPLTHIKARLVNAGLAISRGDPDAEGVGATALTLATTAGFALDPSHPRELIRVRAPDGTLAG